MTELAGIAGPVTCATWIKGRENRILAIMGHRGTSSSLPILEIFGFDAKTAALSEDPLTRFVIEEKGCDPLGFAVHPSGDEFVCSTSMGCRLYELSYEDLGVKILPKDLLPLQSIGRQKCLAFSTDGLKLALGGEDGHLRVFHWPTAEVLLDEPRAHKSFRDLDISLDSEFLVSTSTDGSARIWNINDGAPIVTLNRKSDENFECCRFSRDGMKPFLFCTVEKAGQVVASVWDISTWKRIGHRRFSQKPVSTMSISLDGKYLGFGSKDGDMYIVEVGTMEIKHWNKKLHLGSSISSIEFCPKERVVISTSNQWGATLTKLNVPADWKEWQIYLLFVGLFLASVVVFYFLYKNSDSFWNLPSPRNQPSAPKIESFVNDAQMPDDGPW